MTILAIDASGPSGSVAILRDGGLVYEAMLIREKAHAAHLPKMMEEAFSHAGISLEECGCVACIVGPGSFTGVRVGVAAAQGFAYGRGIPCAAVDALEAFALPFVHLDIVCPILDARAGQVYAAAFGGGKRILPDAALPLTDFLQMVDHLGERLLFVGDGIAKHRKLIQNRYGERALFSVQPLRASSAAFLAFQNQNDWIPAAALRPLYLRAPKAERDRLERSVSPA